MAGALPADLLWQIMATEGCDKSAKLLVCASVSHEFRAIASSLLAAQEAEALNQAIKENRRAIIGIDLEIAPLHGNPGMIEGLRIKQFKPGFSPLESVSYLNENEVLKVGDVIFKVDDDGIDDDANNLLAGMSPELALSKIQGPVGSWLDLTVKRMGETGGITIICQARVIRELKYIVKEGESITAPVPAKSDAGLAVNPGLRLGLLVAVIIIWFLTRQGCIHANCAPGLSYVGSPSALYKNSNPKNVPGAIWLGKYETLWQCEDACISLPSGQSAAVVKGDEVCVAFTYVAHSTKKHVLNGQCYGRVTDGTTLLTVAPVPFPHPDFLGPAGMDGVTSGMPT
jgi:hypothetical protein